MWSSDLSLSGSRTWAENWVNNYLSWAFVVAVVGVVLLHLAGILFLIEGLRQWKTRKERNQMGIYHVSQPSYMDEPIVKHP